MVNKKINLLLVTSVFGFRGVERIITFLYKYLPEDVYEIRIVCLRNLAPYADYLNKNTYIKVDVIGMKNNVDFFALIRFYRYIKDFKPDIINFHSFRAALWGRLIAKFAKVPVILYSVHNRWGGPLHRFLDRSMARFSDAIVPFSFAVKKFITDDENVDDRYVESPIYLGIDINNFSNVKQHEIELLRKELNISKDQNILGFVGDVSEQKGLFYLVESVRNLKTKFPDILCLIIGEGPSENNLKEKLAEYKIDDHFIFLGKRYDTPNLLHVMKIFVLPSLREGLPVVVIEAMAASRPVIATNVDGTPEAITHNKDGWLIPPSDAEALTNAIETLFLDEQLREDLARNGFKTANEKFNIKTMVGNYNNLYQTYLNKQS